MKRIALLILPVVALLALHGTALAQLGDADSPSATADERIRKQLEALELKYELSSTGNYKLVFDMGEGRSQVVIINSSTEKLETLEIREIWSPAYKSKGQLPKDVANQMLESSFDQKIGAWQVMTSDDDHMATYAAKIAANADNKTLMLIIRAVATAADRMESKVTTGDEF